MFGPRANAVIAGHHDQRLIEASLLCQQVQHLPDPLVFGVKEGSSGGARRVDPPASANIGPRAVTVLRMERVEVPLMGANPREQGGLEHTKRGAVRILAPRPGRIY